ncbi:uncharacterized protein MELLADRAFT_103868 [Melampsora larici-populina 98AG31]|uniref:Helicase C-terminal domain-containing protein n=1 Tax=Melampsora larici-populina (strain 98AG31 / pathotype 3-4-7) TaxID=747676 RepID=F4RCU0_MELLP|nr:uncharacterized protein MELLADRAFT_103868 [Melampsora larici-populina 98AG31]EGG09927.1 hypothetical protein MELLADRAFT_103868 [Melampsora larici-populina 98AG31]
MQTGEMVRPELRYIRVSMSEPLETAEDLLSIIPSETVVSNKELPRMLIYSGTIDRTLGVMRAVCNARGNPDDINNGISDCIRRYHSLTGEEDKKERAREFGVEEKFPILSCTPAFEFGQSFKPVKIVVIMGAMDPSISNLIGGRAGRNVDCGLVIHFVQPNMPNSPNTASEVVVTDTMNNEERMHAFRLTPCCLRAAYNMDMDILYRYIPMSLTDPGYLAEMERQRTAGMAVCRCSNCDPQGAARVLRLLPQTKAADLDALIKS